MFDAHTPVIEHFAMENDRLVRGILYLNMVIVQFANCIPWIAKCIFILQASQAFAGDTHAHNTSQ